METNEKAKEAIQSKTAAYPSTTITTIVPISGKRLHASRFGLAESRRQIWQIVIDGSTEYDELFDKDYWGFVASKIRPYDHIEVLTDTDSFFAELLVLAAGKAQLVVKELRKIDIPPSERTEAEESYGVKWAGPYSKYRVFRESDGAKIKEGFETADDARAYLIANNKRPVA